MRDLFFFGAGIFVTALFAVLARWARFDKADALRAEAADEMRHARALAAACGVPIIGGDGNLGPTPTVPVSVPDEVEVGDALDDADAEPAAGRHRADAEPAPAPKAKPTKRFLGFVIAAREPFDIGDAWVNDIPAPAATDLDAELAELVDAEQVLA